MSKLFSHKGDSTMSELVIRKCTAYRKEKGGGRLWKFCGIFFGSKLMCGPMLSPSGL